MTRQRKTRDENVVQGYYDSRCGWEDLVTEDTRTEALARLREYRENEPQYRHRLIVRRVRLDARGVDPRGTPPLEDR